MGSFFSMLDGLEFWQYPLAAVRFLLSGKFRAELRGRWRQGGQLAKRRDQAGLFLGWVILAVFLVLILFYLA